MHKVGIFFFFLHAMVFFCASKGEKRTKYHTRLHFMSVCFMMVKAGSGKSFLFSIFYLDIHSSKCFFSSFNFLEKME